MKSFEKSYKKILEEINALRREINDSLDQLEKNTKMKLDTLLAKMRTSIQTDIENCTKSIKHITCLKEDLLRRKDKSEAQSFRKYRKCLDQSLKVEAVLQEMKTKNEITLTFNPETTIKQCMSTLSGLGQILSTMKQSQPSKMTTHNTVTRENTANPSTSRFKVNKSNPESSSSRQYSSGNQTGDLAKSGQVSDPVSSSSRQLIQGHQQGAVSKPDQIIKVKRSENYSVKTEGDSQVCCISGICETATGGLLITDYMNNWVKLLDHNYKVVAHCDLPYSPFSICSIDSSQVAITLNNSEVHFIRVTNGQLVRDRILKLQHYCWDTAYHQGNLYITGGTALYCYTVDGILVSKIYKDTSADCTVTRCAVSPDGDRIYVVNGTSKQLVTLSRDGTVISKLTDSVLACTGRLLFSALHVTDSGQGGGACNTIIQVDKDGRQRLSEVVTRLDGVTDPISVYYSEHRGSLIVGMRLCTDIIVFKAQ